MTMVEQMAGTAPEAEMSRLAKILGYVPRVLASKPHIMFLALLGVYLVVLPLAHVHVSSFAELVGGNYTNVTSDLGACIAAGGTLHVIRSHRQHRAEIAELRQLLHEVRSKLS